MNRTDFYAKLKNAPRPVVVDLWAPWCGPCRAMEPAFKQISQKFTGQVDVLKINADQSPDVLAALGVMGIPTVLAFAKDKEILRRTGMQSAGMLDLLFNAAVNRRKPDIIPPAPMDRTIRTGAGMFMLIIGWFLGWSWPIMGVGAVLIFSAFYDRCPIYRAIIPRLNAMFQKSKGT
jgi:thioredoxin